MSDHIKGYRKKAFRQSKKLLVLCWLFLALAMEIGLLGSGQTIYTSLPAPGQFVLGIEDVSSVTTG
jgi:hypothetical protein